MKEKPPIVPNADDMKISVETCRKCSYFSNGSTLTPSGKCQCKDPVTYLKENVGWLCQSFSKQTKESNL